MVYMFLANGFEEVEALCPLDLLRRAGVSVTTVAIGGNDTVIGSHGIAVQADMPEALYRDAKPEMIVLPGGMPGAPPSSMCCLWSPAKALPPWSSPVSSTRMNS